MKIPILCMDEATRAFAFLSGGRVFEVRQLVPCGCGRLFESATAGTRMPRCSPLCPYMASDWPNVGQIIEHALRVLHGAP